MHRFRLFRGKLEGPWWIKNGVGAAAIGIVLIAASLLVGPSWGCHIPAIYNFGDSNSDTGSASAAFGRLPPPYGETFFGKPSGRYSDGRLIIDFIAEKLGLPFLSAYLDSIEPNFRHGANFAASGSTIQPTDAKLFGAGFSPLSLNIQLLQFEQFKDRTKEPFNQVQSSWIKNNLPRPEEFSKALYTLDSGQNDFHFGLVTEEQVRASIPNIIDMFAVAVKKLYQEGARTFWIHNTGPIGCLPFFAVWNPPKHFKSDKNGCIKSYNQLAQEFNKQLKDKVFQLRTQLHHAVLIYVDIYTAKYTLISEAEKQGFVSPLEYCCGHLGVAECWQTSIVNGTEVFAASCSDPSKHISWDGVHYTEAANKWVANHIVDGSLSDPPIPLTKSCHSADIPS
ncbi:GDSL esterase/lipase At3g27950-like isoform X2 [Quercus robur]|uniref:GDSL esterase/lipase At3g27950-like isoform X2 n=1 Tax=Quercus robur TaxID=38942 RepID=UPI0021614978|nr:GDSL esterase/lipase At3g27950-like isoform X2 [Quercus robur]XP_050276481.1 GDSL esterase/lipase At3g27950-like isoform X2 [Quercus robur]XP_050276482.1 GDSL esterase/lipase At3g27950-like isoform X2 [Quercus robur]XP_050276483.1 GDSL esterase/lipase At3g27950-like isoform X2 [Quercus robur]